MATVAASANSDAMEARKSNQEAFTDKEVAPLDAPKHQLENTWTFWYFEGLKDKSWEDNLRVVSSFGTVEDFWSLFNHIKRASEIKVGSSYYVFKEGIKPMWEDPANKAGGRWLIAFEKKFRHHLDNNWLEVLLCLIGEACDEAGDDICGAAVDSRGKADKISIWTSDVKNKDRICHIGRMIKNRITTEDKTPFVYEAHDDSQNKSSSNAKHMYSINDIKG